MFQGETSITTRLGVEKTRRCDDSWVVATQIFFMFNPKIWEDDSQFDEHIFQMGWFNHHLVMIW